MQCNVPRMKRIGWGLLISGLLAGCSTQTIALESSRAPELYKQLIADGDTARTLRSRLALGAPLQVSPLRPSVLTQPGDWTACIMVVSQGRLPPEPEDGSSDDRKPPLVKWQPPPRPLPQGPMTVSYYAIFFRNGEIAESRRSVVIDHCARLSYSPLPKASKPKAGSKSDR